MNWPAFKKEELILGNGTNIGICTLWTKKEDLAKYVSPSNFSVIGQCYSRIEGPSFILRNYLANKSLSYLVLTGRDLNHSAEALIALSEKGIDNNRKIIGVEGAKIEDGIPLEAIERFRQNVRVIDARNISNENLDDFLAAFPKTTSWGDPELYERPEPSPPQTFPSEKAGFFLRGKTVAELWPQILSTILRFGKVKPSAHEKSQKELIGLTTILTQENPLNPKWASYFPFSKKDLEEYSPQLMSPEIPEGLAYTYGSRLRKYKGVDQIEKIIGELKVIPHSRREIAITWDVEKDSKSKNPPCLILLQSLIQDGKLYQTGYFRSNEMYDAWPRNAFLLRRLQAEIAQGVEVDLGEMTIVSNSAHIYSSHWDEAEKIAARRRIPRLPDPRGNLLVEVNDAIYITHLSPEGEPIQRFSAATARNALLEIEKRQLISQIGHAGYIGTELAKAEYALHHNRIFKQDAPID